MDRFILIMKSDLRAMIPAFLVIFVIIGGVGVVFSSIFAYIFITNLTNFSVENSLLSNIICPIVGVLSLGFYSWLVTIVFRLMEYKNRETTDFT